MLTRRHIRIKVMQSLYAYFTNQKSQKDVDECIKDLLSHSKGFLDLYLSIISLLIELFKFTRTALHDRKNKFLATKDDLNPNTKFLDNFIVKQLICNDNLTSSVSKFSSIWLREEHGIIRRLYNNLINSELYLNYIKLNSTTVDEDKSFFIEFLNNIILNNPLLHELLEEESIYWTDDLPFLSCVIVGDIKNSNKILNKKLYKNNSDKDFAIKLFKKTVNCNNEFELIIQKLAQNWDIERIASIDKLLIKMSFTELIFFEQLPIKVSLNEYIEISKYYSTKKSRLFVNGILDNAVKYFIKEGRINKKGRGLFN